ncbi:hypothetical protein Pecwa_0151 [Pectobacterium parmentieri WPP163]|uniref:Uncharacterized protein n=1 Tax=Pectobacterium parmentieri TaxID=1905730 RepID=A0A0H3HWU4_PECPM|nr:hypothetical protein Pecwa_0151 [Pectobacterium parmentieri WPP163]AFI88296.1 Hypothetical protein W5S_0157 [Pectobacterium parmentieri]AOR60695.1 hypothetical protein A8F97_17640 [Pectobacterium parmentieri]AYH04044.1 hypothetical protein C5E25_00770 [Pectobacterium parmentieri]AYH08371.1 hypothetical protein C5E24_00740 [Pectobacterium parmentieri]
MGMCITLSVGLIRLGWLVVIYFSAKKESVIHLGMLILMRLTIFGGEVSMMLLVISKVVCCIQTNYLLAILSILKQAKG